MESFWEGRSPRTVKAYRDNLTRVAAWAGFPSLEAFAVHFFTLGPGGAYQVAHEFKAWALGKGWAPSYINNHLAALRSLVKFARRIDHIVWTLDIQDVKVESYRDTRGPGFAGLVALIEAAAAQADSWAAARDSALIAIFATMGLRLDEVARIDLGHLDFAGRRLLAKRKKKSQPVWVTVPEETFQAIRAWLEVRGTEPGPLFLSRAFRRQRTDRRLANSSIWAIVRKLAAKAGIQAWPHGLRHAAITHVLDLTNGNIRAAQKFAGHANPAVTTRYDDNREDLAGQLAGQLASAIGEAVRRRSPQPPRK